MSINGSDGVYGPHCESSKTGETRSQLPNKETTDRMALLASAFADPNRVRLLLTVKGGPVCVGELALILSLSQSAVSHQLKLLRTMGLVISRRSGRHICYELARSETMTILDTLSRAVTLNDQTDT